MTCFRSQYELLKVLGVKDPLCWSVFNFKCSFYLILKFGNKSIISLSCLIFIVNHRILIRHNCQIPKHFRIFEWYYQMFCSKSQLDSICFKVKHVSFFSCIKINMIDLTLIRWNKYMIEGIPNHINISG